MFIGMKPVVVLNGVEAIKDALLTKGLDFAGRPHNLMVNHLTAHKGKHTINHVMPWLSNYVKSRALFLLFMLHAV